MKLPEPKSLFECGLEYIEVSLHELRIGGETLVGLAWFAKQSNEEAHHQSRS